MNQATKKNADTGTTTEKKLKDLYALIDGIEICLMTTRRPDGSLVARPMDTQAHERGCDLWFMTTTDTHKLDELEQDPNVNLGYYKGGEWVSVSGTVRIVRDRARIHELYKPDWKMWLADEGGDKDGGPDDPRIVLIEVEAESVHYFKRTQPRPVVLFEMAKAFVTGQPPKIGENRTLEKDELRAGR